MKRRGLVEKSVVGLLLCAGMFFVWFDARAQVLYREQHFNYGSCISLRSLIQSDVDFVRALSSASVLDVYVVVFCWIAVALSPRSKAFSWLMVVCGIPVALVAVQGAREFARALGGPCDFDGEQISENLIAFQGYALCFAAVIVRAISRLVRRNDRLDG